MAKHPFLFKSILCYSLTAIAVAITTFTLGEPCDRLCL